MTSQKWGRWEEKWERKPLKKMWIIPHFYDVTWLIFETLCSVTSFGNVGNPRQALLAARNKFDFVCWVVGGGEVWMIHCRVRGMLHMSFIIIIGMFLLFFIRNCFFFWFIYLSINLSIHLSIHPFIYLSNYLSNNLSIWLSLFPSIYSFIYQ